MFKVWVQQDNPQLRSQYKCFTYSPYLSSLKLSCRCYQKIYFKSFRDKNILTTCLLYTWQFSPLYVHCNSCVVKVDIPLICSRSVFYSSFMCLASLCYTRISISLDVQATQLLISVYLIFEEEFLNLLQLIPGWNCGLGLTQKRKRQNWQGL